MEQKIILVVDDDPVNRKLIKEFLEDSGYEVIEASDGTFALDILAKNGSKISLVLSDMDMPHMDGLTMLRQAQAKWPQIPIILMSGMVTEDNKEMAIILGASEFLDKPFSAAMLFFKIDQVLKNRR